MEPVSTLLEVAVYSAALFCAVLLLRFALGRWLSPRACCLLWLLLIVRLMIPVTFESGFHFITLPQETVQTESAPAQITSRPRETAANGGAAQAADAGTSAQTQAAASSGEAAAETAQQALTGMGIRLTWREWALLAWGMGALAVLAVYGCMGAQLERRIREEGRAPDAATRRLYREVCAAVGCRRPLRLVLMEEIGSPALTVRLRPALLLPAGMQAAGGSEAVALAMAHELTHYRRGDHALCLLMILLRALWWFNPVVWLMVRPMRADMESACDARVVRDMDNRQKLRYAKLLVSLGEADDTKEQTGNQPKERTKGDSI